MSTGNINANYKKLLKELDRVNTENTISVYVPSVKKTVKFKAITVKQQKDIIKSASDPTLMNLAFNVTVNNIIKDNCIDGGVNFKLHDKVPILLALRAHTISKTYTVNDGEDDVKIDLLSHLKNLKSVSVDKDTLNFTLSVDNITIECTAPSLDTDTAVNRDALRALANKGVDVDEITQFKLIETVGDMYTYELVKYIDSVSITPEGSEDSDVIDFADINTIQKLNILEALPMTLSQQFVDHVGVYKEFENKALTPDESKESTTITLDPSFFATE